MDFNYHLLSDLNNIRIQDLHHWFSSYVLNFKQDEHGARMIELKEEHSKRVCSLISAIGKSLGLSENKLLLAEVTALFHDIGRFEQYARYRTFVDQKSVNHAELGVQILQSHCVLHFLAEPTASLILRIIRYHNRSLLPPDETEICLFFARLLRDADKLDIFRVVTDYYNSKEGRRHEAIELGLPDAPECSEAVYTDLENQRPVDIHHVKTLNDLKLLQIGWVFDINFEPTFKILNSMHYLEMIRHVLPDSERMDILFSQICAYLENRLATGYKEGKLVSPSEKPLSP
ncbi:MAG: HD domain-containing protein [Syntrophus sp. (in: bacteria)]|nr:HD domain-containing protein [Syntrophus sp. (in: bacteria)]